MNNASLLRSWDAFHKFEEQLIASEPVDFARNLRLADDFYEYARRLGKIPGPDPLEGLERQYPHGTGLSQCSRNYLKNRFLFTTNYAMIVKRRGTRPRGVKSKDYNHVKDSSAQS